MSESLKIAAQTAAHEACKTPDAVTDLNYIQNTIGAKVYFVRPDNDSRLTEDGDGSSWDKAFSLSGFMSHIANGNLVTLIILQEVPTILRPQLQSRSLVNL